MCHGDLTVEKPNYIGDQEFEGSTGWGFTHQCRDWNKLNKFFSSHAVAFFGEHGYVRSIAT
jgi:hypothetical protein